ncbi:MAG: DUF4956 domain-containing protein [Oscillospiraceae bacterium]|nr:DUF4956 domain-containing protein [Oscillospiraceae bacterium]
MLNSIIVGTEITVPAFFICTLTSLLLGLGAALLCMYKNRYSQSFAITLALLPAMVQVVIMLVNGNIGAGVAVAGAFGLVRFRSAPGSAREIGLIFLAVTLGIATGMGYVALAVVFFLIIAIYGAALTSFRFGAGRAHERTLKITIGENLDYDGLFDDLLDQYASHWELAQVKTTNMGTLYELTYKIVLKEERVPKEFLDALRLRNGNLNIVCGRIAEKEAL